jgi:hypothetical protein
MMGKIIHDKVSSNQANAINVIQALEDMSSHREVHFRYSSENPEACNRTQMNQKDGASSLFRTTPISL